MEEEKIIIPATTDLLNDDKDHELQLYDSICCASDTDHNLQGKFDHNYTLQFHEELNSYG